MKNNIKETESKQLHSMAKNMQKFLSDTKGIPCRVIQTNSKEKSKDEDGNEIDAPAIYEIVGTKNKKGSKRFTWKITFDLSSTDDKNRFPRHLILEPGDIDFTVTKNSQLTMILDNYQYTKIIKKEKETATESK